MMPFCGVTTWLVLAQLWGFDCLPGDVCALRQSLWRSCPISVCHDDVGIGFGPHGQLLKNLVSELAKHGIPAGVVEDRAKAAIKTLGSEQILEALNHRQPWRQLKMFWNNSKFQFVLPSELAVAVEANKGKPVSTKGKGKGKSKMAPQTVDLDPSKLQVLEGTFRSQDRVLPQLSMKQIGPVSSGFILMTLQDAQPYLKAGTQVSQEPLALVVLLQSGADAQTILPHGLVTVPCRCTLNNEPVLAEAVIVQVGKGLVEKTVGNTVLAVDTPDVVTLKVLVYKDEPKKWEEFCQSPIKRLVSLLLMLKRCTTADCHCSGWHNLEQLPIRDPILDVWRRQFLRQGFKPCPPQQAEFFSVCLRIPQCLLESLLAASGTSGAYCEPRTADGKEVLSDYILLSGRQNTATRRCSISCRPVRPLRVWQDWVGDRRGLRVRTAQAKVIHQLVRPDTVYLPSAPKCQFSVGPFLIAKMKQETTSASTMPNTVGSAATLALCGKQQGGNAESDPWALHDPWRTYQPSHVASGPQEGLQQIEDRIQNVVLAKMQPPMEQDDLPDRVHALEGQVQQLLSKQQGLENQFHEHSTEHSQQIHALQGQVAAQTQQLHGHLENQNQTIQSLFEQQMQRIRGLLSKRPRDEGME